MNLKKTPGSNKYWQTQRNITHRSSTQGGSFYLWHKNIRHLDGLTYRTRSKWHPALRNDAAGLDVGCDSLFSPGQSVLPTKGIYRRLQPCYAIDLHFKCLSELRNKGSVKHEEDWSAGRPWSCLRFQSLYEFLTWSVRGLWSISSATCLFVLCSTSLCE